jgi:hypothetical protein
MALNETLNCPACNFHSDEFFGECPKCGVIVGKYHETQLKKRQNQDTERLKKQEQEAFNKKVESTVKQGAKGLALGLWAGIVIFSIGVAFLLFIPLIGWIIGPLLMMGAFAAPFMLGTCGIVSGVGTTGNTVLKGKCPYCTGLIDVTVLATQKGQVLGVDCPICKKRFVVKGQTFCAV